MQDLIAGAQELQIALKPEQLDALRRYQRLLVRWNERFNLTPSPMAIGVQIHATSSILSPVCSHWNLAERYGGERIIDVGTGTPGFPKIRSRLWCPAIKLTLLGATAKKVRFSNTWSKRWSYRTWS